MKIVVFDGPSGSGKTTLRYKLFQELNYEVLTIDRFTPSMWVYKYLRSGKERTDIFDIEDKMNLFDSTLVLCLCDSSILRKRISDNTLRSVVFDASDECRAFEKYLKVSHYRSIININTGIKSVNDCIDEIVERL